MRAMILAAGLGTRFKPWTDRHPKALAMVNGRSLLQRNIEYLQSAGIYEVVVNVHHFVDQIVEALRVNHGWGSKVMVSDERDDVLETGGGLKKAAGYLCAENWEKTDSENAFSNTSLIKENQESGSNKERGPSGNMERSLPRGDAFVLMNVDVLTDLDLTAMIGAHRKLMPLATIATTNRTSSRYFLFDHLDNLCGWKNEKTGEERMVRTTADAVAKAFSGVHVIDPRIFSLIRQTGKFSMIELYLSLAETEIIKSFDHSGTNFIDVGKPEAVAAAQKMFR